MRSSSRDFNQRQRMWLQAVSAGWMTYFFQNGSTAYPAANPANGHKLWE